MNEEERIPWHILVNGLISYNKDAFFHALFLAISKHPSYVIVSDMEIERKEEILTKMLSYYEEREDFEKCSVLFNIKKELKLC
ncbi:hypothetical protein OAC86_00075 [bacterium]|jgi:hypothetical protein|nr:hypothetical protein [bacterium]MDB9899920.1 hypothetical protein [bacterium]|tara:strand:- start:1298 stop:1546 length:249 start_codon:yes stop_codon:yes gene_type:complete